MRLTILALAATCTLGACNAGSTEFLTGEWGGSGIELSASSTGAVIVLTCGVVVRVDQPLVLDASSQFALDEPELGPLAGASPSDTVSGNSATPGIPARLVGSITGNTLTLVVRYVASPDSVTFQGERNRQASSKTVCRT